MIRKFCRIFCVVFLIGDFQSSLSQFDDKNINYQNLNRNNGSIALLGDALHQASIRLIDQDITFGEGHICSGSLISPRVVLTAARCLFNLNSKRPRHPSELIVVMGTMNRYQRTLDTIVSRITHIRYPTTFDLETMRDDIGLLFLSSKIPENSLIVRPIELNWKTAGSNLQGFVTGWVLFKNGDISHQLLAANVSIVERINCTNNFEQPPITKSMICAVYKQINKEICQSDVGGPLVYAGKQIGLASWTLSSCSTNNSDQLAVYTDVAYHREWIQTELTDENNSDSSVWGVLGILTLTWFAFKEKQKLSFKF